MIHKKTAYHDHQVTNSVLHWKYMEMTFTIYCIQYFVS